MDLKAYAKINLTLDVLGKREDGYHEVEMIMQTIDLYDRLSFSQIDTGIEIETNHPYLPTGKNNLVYQAAELLFDEFNPTSGIKIRIDKQIPLAAGLAGGSTNAAATLVAINQLWDLGLSKEELAIRGAKLGADVPFCIEGGTQLATGTGTDLEKLPAVSELYLVVVNPPLEVSTAQVYQNLPLSDITDHPQTEKVINALKREDKIEVVSNMDNVLENATLQLYPEVAKLKDKMNQWADKVLMSGSGPTILGFVERKEEVKKVKEKIEQELTTDHRVLVAKTVDQGIEGI
ncbi:4-(cytidine 5'-diphospho)-2-C-methyl-D-erythritol kinase [Halanaerocella petrolearia]